MSVHLTLDERIERGTRIHTTDSPNLDFVRAFAVMTVYFGHALQTFHIFQVFRRLTIFDFAQTGVLIFFVHTSLVLMLSLDRAKLTGSETIYQLLYKTLVSHLSSQHRNCPFDGGTSVTGLSWPPLHTAGSADSVVEFGSYSEFNKKPFVSSRTLESSFRSTDVPCSAASLCHNQTAYLAMASRWFLGPERHHCVGISRFRSEGGFLAF